MDEDLLLRGDQGGEFLNVRRKPGNLILLPDHAGSEFGDFFRLNMSRCRGRMLQDHDLCGHRTPRVLALLPHSIRPDGTLLRGRGVLHRSVGDRKGFTNARMGLVLIARHVGKEVNHLAPAQGSGIEQDLTVGRGDWPSLIYLLLRWNSVDEVDGFFVESRGHPADPPFIRTYWDTYDVPTPRAEKSQPFYSAGP